ncbi:hypothetical protein GCM10022267_49140 [Lentzea roselyniae]|uniref:Uncharacterized protein n=1 Tax=Lentzea roselyniae TaxID=531940 RepID=A0ABP7BD47_9PSEU
MVIFARDKRKREGDATGNRHRSRRGGNRMRAHPLSLVEGPLRLLDGNFPHRDAMREIAEHNIERALLC